MRGRGPTPCSICGVVRYGTVARSATVHSVNMTQKGQLSEADQLDLSEAMEDWRRTEETRAMIRSAVVEMVEKSSYREVARLTGLSTNTLQRWKREAGK